MISTMIYPISSFFFFFNDTATTEIYTLSLHDALPISAICRSSSASSRLCPSSVSTWDHRRMPSRSIRKRSEEHTSELQSQSNLVCRLLLEKKKKTANTRPNDHRTYISLVCTHSGITRYILY